MSLDFGTIEDVTVFGAEIQITGHIWVGLAFDQDRPYKVTRLRGVDEADLCRQNIDLVKSASDVYDSNLRKVDGRCIVSIAINGIHEVTFHCDEITEDYRYYTTAEIERIFEWLPSRSTEQAMRKYIIDLKAHGIGVSSESGKVKVFEIELK